MKKSEEQMSNKDCLSIRSTLVKSSAKIIENREEYIIQRTKDLNILHIGCVGNRNYENPLHLKISNSAKECIGWDINSSGIELLNKLHPSLKIENVDICKSIPNSNKKFDLILFGEVIEHLDNPGIAIKNCSNLLSNNGVILVTVPNAFGIRNY